MNTSTNRGILIEFGFDFFTKEEVKKQLRQTPSKRKQALDLRLSIKKKDVADLLSDCGLVVGQEQFFHRKMLFNTSHDHIKEVLDAICVPVKDCNPAQLQLLLKDFAEAPALPDTLLNLKKVRLVVDGQAQKPYRVRPKRYQAAS